METAHSNQNVAVKELQIKQEEAAAIIKHVDVPKVVIKEEDVEEERLYTSLASKINI